MAAQCSESTRLEYAARMNRVVDHIQAHLDEPLDLERLAAIACFSPFHFHRLFRAWTGETLQVFVQRLRLERAAQMLTFDRSKSISAIAFEYGFSSSGAFSRAFRRGFAVSPGEWRKSKICQPNRKQGEAEESHSLGISNLAGTNVREKEMHLTRLPLDVKVRRIAPATIAYLRHIGPYKGDTTLFQRLFRKLFAWAEPRGLIGPDMRYLSLFHDNPNLTPAAKQRLEVALIVPADTPPSGEIGIRALEHGLYATARIYVRIEDYAAQWDALVRDWLPDSGYQPDSRPAMEFYLNNPETDPEGKYDVEICLPVRPLQ